MNTVTFESRLLPDGHLYCPKKYAYGKKARFKVMVVFEDSEMEASDHEIEISSIKDISYGFLSQKELSYYLTLEEV